MWRAMMQAKKGSNHGFEASSVQRLSLTGASRLVLPVQARRKFARPLELPGSVFSALTSSCDTLSSDPESSDMQPSVAAIVCVPSVVVSSPTQPGRVDSVIHCEICWRSWLSITCGRPPGRRAFKSAWPSISGGWSAGRRAFTGVSGMSTIPAALRRFFACAVVAPRRDASEPAECRPLALNFAMSSRGITRVSPDAHVCLAKLKPAGAVTQAPMLLGDVGEPSSEAASEPRRCGSGGSSGLSIQKSMRAGVVCSAGSVSGGACGATIRGAWPR
mmetsp:Transcript_1495/g.4515  ORF Transcript_1495/g.4515 Transcript_1495/m.4515 type:complete len:274 (+) Transcript_1495:1646-2467(+)